MLLTTKHKVHDEGLDFIELHMRNWVRFANFLVKMR